MKKKNIIIASCFLFLIGLIYSVQSNKNNNLQNYATNITNYMQANQNNSLLTLKSIEVVTENGEYKTDDVISFKVTWSDVVYSRLGKEIKRISSPNLYIRFGDGKKRKADFERYEGNVLYYEYEIKKRDHGQISLVEYEGNVFDKDKSKSVIGEIELSGNTAIIANKEEINADNEENLEEDQNKNENDDPVIEDNTNNENQEEEDVDEENQEDIIINDNSNVDNNENNNSSENKNTSEMSTEELIQFIKDTYKVTSGISKNGGEVLYQIKDVLNDIPSLSLLDLINFIKEIEVVYSFPRDTGMKTYSTSNDVARLTTYSNSDKEKGPIAITPGTLHSNGKDIDVYWISLGGTEFVDGQATDIATDILTGLELNNDYLIGVYNAILDNIPLNSNIVLTGISLGGMVAQQVASQDAIKEYYNILNIVTYGSPIITPTKREGTTRRLCDSMDIVPTLSISNSSENVLLYDSVEKMVETGGYKSPISAHTFSYIDNEVWRKYDVLGFKNGNSSVTLNLDQMKFYDAPLS